MHNVKIKHRSISKIAFIDLVTFDVSAIFGIFEFFRETKINDMNDALSKQK